MILNNKVYDVLKWILTIVVPAAITLICGLGKLYGYDVTNIVTLIALISTFLGAITGISNINYYNKEEE